VSAVVSFVRQQGGFCTRAQATAATSEAEVDRALARGEIVWLSRGRYGLPELDRDIAAAHGLNAVLSHLSAALWHGWEVKTLPATTHVTVPRRRHRAYEAPKVTTHRSDLPPNRVTAGIVTSVEQTLLDCLRHLPFDEALTVADSALRHGVPRSVLRRIAATVRGPGSPQVRRVCREATHKAANPFESCLRAIAMRVKGLDVCPQHVIVGTRQSVRPDLVDLRLKVAIEADSFEWHSSRVALRRDARRYNLLVIDGWIVLRFSYEDVMFDPEYVFDVLNMVVDTRTQVGLCPLCAA
jgi:very-short-patch-repair endonuclease